ncbi:MAG TPA: imidazole glycerol phosphate synthase subunit HisH [Actinomycetota bacterium]|nr:imidazole glycerol phosphate synthase subunit HisH [Actinomycetota bacterium]
MKVGVVDYRMGNLASVSKALERVGARAFVSDDKQELATSDLLVLPGVGNFTAGMANLKQFNLIDPVSEWARDGRPLLGICLGMQLLFDSSQEGESEGLGILTGDVVRLAASVKVPHMGWNSISARGSEIFEGSDGRSFYFVHSYVCRPETSTVGAVTEYGDGFASGVHIGSICGVQFHPEKSSHDGLALLAKIVEVLV